MYGIDAIAILNVMVVVTALITLWYSIHLMAELDHTRVIGWWTVLPIVILYGVLNRVAVLMCSLDYPPISPELISAMILPLWIGLLIFVRGLYQSARELKELQRVKE